LQFNQVYKIAAIAAQLAHCTLHHAHSWTAMASNWACTNKNFM